MGVSARIILKGAVQGIGLRYVILREARTCKITGYVKNLENGTIEILCSGQRNDIESLIERIRRLDEPVSITDVSSEYLDDVKHFDAFRMVTGNMGMEMAEGFGICSMYLEKLVHGQDQMISKWKCVH